MWWVNRYAGVFESAHLYDSEAAADRNADRDNALFERHVVVPRASLDALRLQLDEAREERDHWRGAFDEASLHVHAAAEFRGNSVGYWYDKATAYGRIVGELHEISGAKGGTDVRDAVRTLRAQLAEAEQKLDKAIKRAIIAERKLAEATGPVSRETLDVVAERHDANNGET